MSKHSAARKNSFGATFKSINLDRYFNWPSGAVRGKWWKEVVARVLGYAQGRQESWGVPFRMGSGKSRRVIKVAKGDPAVTIPCHGRADYFCILHDWLAMPEDQRWDSPREGLVVAEYELTYADGSKHIQPIRGRFEVYMAESPGPAWLAVYFHQDRSIDPEADPTERPWGLAQTGQDRQQGFPLHYALPNPQPEKTIRSVTVRCFQDSPILLAGLTLYQGSSHPLRGLPRRTYRVSIPGKPAQIEKAQVDLGGVARIEQTTGPRGKKWLNSPYVGLSGKSLREPLNKPESLLEVFGAEDATLSVKLKGRAKPLDFSVGQAFHRGRAEASSGQGSLRVLGKTRQWMKVTVKDSSSKKPVPVRIHFSGPRGEYIAPYGHHAQINVGWFHDYGADVQVGGRNFAYVPGEFTSDMPVGEVYVEISKGFEYQPIRKKVTIKPGQKVLELTIDRALDWRQEGWVTADTHVHFLSPHTSALQAQGEGVNIVNLLASQWGRLFTNVGDFRGRVGVLEEDTIVYVGTENRNHMLGHMSMLGTEGLPVYPMCAGGPSEAWLGDPDFVTLAEWALENKRKGGVVIRPHYPQCGHTEDPVPIIKGLVDALEIRGLRGSDFPTQEWYRYLNCGYPVAVVGGTDKMGAQCVLGWMRTYALLDSKRPFTYDNWAKAVRAGRTFSTTGPLIDLTVDGRRIGQSIKLPSSGGTLEVQARAQSVWPLGKIEIVHNGRVVAAEQAKEGKLMLRASAKVSASCSGWIAARCSGLDGHPGGYIAAHTSPVYLKVGRTRAFDAPAAQHMLGLVQGGMEYLNTLATVFDESSRKRMVKLFKEVQQELQGRLIVEARHGPHHGHGPYHRHDHSKAADHQHS